VRRSGRPCTFRQVSILAVRVVGEGIFFATDRNVTIELPDASPARIGQSQRPKVLKWPNREVIVGFVGLARLGLRQQPTDLWLYDFIGEHLDEGESLGELATALKDRLELAFQTEDPVEPEGLTVHLGGFVERDGQWAPEVWFIRNSHGMDETGRYINVTHEFDVSEELSTPGRFIGMTGNEIRERVRTLAAAGEPFWFHQGYDLGTFNILDVATRAGMKMIIDQHKHAWRVHRQPATAEEWERHLRMSVLVYGAYFDAFYPAYEQYVGGGADVVWAAWPSVPPNR
jgi:hypothetical protein